MTRELLIAQMKRCIELLEEDVKPFEGERRYFIINRKFSELEAKLKEVRRDSIRFIKEARRY